jgi:hypothetical protein
MMTADVPTEHRYVDGWMGPLSGRLIFVLAYAAGIRPVRPFPIGSTRLPTEITP